MVTRISTSRPSAPAISSLKTTAADDSATSRRPLALATSGHSSGAVFFDYNRDGRLDLFLVNVGKLYDEHDCR